MCLAMNNEKTNRNISTMVTLHLLLAAEGVQPHNEYIISSVLMMIYLDLALLPDFGLAASRVFSIREQSNISSSKQTSLDVFDLLRKLLRSRPRSQALQSHG